MSDSIQSAPTRPDASEDTPQPAPVPDAPVPDAPAPETHVSKDAPDAPALDVRALTDRALHFLANASNETLGACLVGLSAATYLVLGRVGLVLIGVAGGVVLHATWEAHAHAGNATSNGEGPDRKRRENGVDVAHRLLDWRHTTIKDGGNKVDHDCDLDVKLSSGKELDFSNFRPETGAALTELVDAITRDYVKYVGELLPIDTSNAL
jgi:hypothetical protein